MAVFLIRSTDVGAPIYDGTPAGYGTFMNVMDYVLVTRAGYTKVNSDTYSAIYQPPTPIGGGGVK